MRRPIAAIPSCSIRMRRPSSRRSARSTACWRRPTRPGRAVPGHRPSHRRRGRSRRGRRGFGDRVRHVTSRTWTPPSSTACGPGDYEGLGQAVREGLFTELGAGILDLDGVLRRLARTRLRRLADRRAGLGLGSAVRERGHRPARARGSAPPAGDGSHRETRREDRADRRRPHRPAPCPPAPVAPKGSTSVTLADVDGGRAPRSRPRPA